jgi:hypothetical protein
MLYMASFGVASYVAFTAASCLTTEKRGFELPIGSAGAFKNVRVLGIILLLALVRLPGLPRMGTRAAALLEPHTS